MTPEQLRNEIRARLEYATTSGENLDYAVNSIEGLIAQVTKEAWTDGFMTSGEGYNGEYLGSSITKGRTVDETVRTDIYEREHPSSKDDGLETRALTENDQAREIVDQMLKFSTHSKD